MATQILVIFLIRTHNRFWTSRAHPFLILSSLAALAAAIAIVMSPVGFDFGFVSLPISIFGMVILLVFVYLAAAEITKAFATRISSNVR